MAELTKVFLGSVSLDDTCRACKVAQQDEAAKLTAIKGALLKKADGTQTNVNVASFEDVNILDILDDLKFIDISTAAGVSDAAAANHDFTLMFACKIFVQDELKDIQVFGRKTP
jgi:hypothetical protein